MTLVYIAVALLGLLSIGQSAPVTGCESLTQTIEIQPKDKMLGKWIFSAESTNIPGSRFLMKKFVETAWSQITAANESDSFNVFQSQKMLSGCFTLRTEMHLENNTLSMAKPFPASIVLLNTGCSDCLVLYSKYNLGENEYNGLQLLSKRQWVTATDMEEFLKQVECLNFPPPAIMDPEKELCPEESPSQDIRSTDLTGAMNNMGSDIVDSFGRFISSDGGLGSLVEMISGKPVVKLN